MSRVPMPETTGVDRQAQSDRRHAANVLLPLSDWYRAQEAATFDPNARSASDIIRKALAKYLDEHEDSTQITKLAEVALARDDELDARRNEMLRERMKR